MAAPPLDWERDGPTWPNADLSRFVEAGGIRWHVQMAGSGPVLLLVHGTAASTHSWRALIRPLAARFTVVALDLPGHGFTSSLAAAAGFSLPAMAAAIGELMRVLGLAPALAAGHSAGAAILARMALDGHLAPSAIVSFNGAFLPFGGWAGQLFAPIARLIALSPFVPSMLAARGADPTAVRRLIGGTGSRLDDEGIALYGRLMRDTRHVRGAISMMANWDLAPLASDLPRLPCPLNLVVGDRDRSIPPHQARVVGRLAPQASVVVQPGLGHLSHEERPDEAVAIILEEGARAGLTSP